MKKIDPQPPAIFRCFFRWFCHPDLVDFIEGDLMQLYNEKVRECGTLKADVKFILDVLLLFRPGIIRPLRGQKTLIPYGMYKNHFKVGLRNIVKQKVFFLINTIGLSAGLTCFAFITLWVNDEIRYDTFNKNYDQIVRVVTKI